MATRFDVLKRSLAAKKATKGGPKDAAALAAWIGRKKYGKSEFQRMAVAGRKKAGMR